MDHGINTDIPRPIRNIYLSDLWFNYCPEVSVYRSDDNDLSEVIQELLPIAREFLYLVSKIGDTGDVTPESLVEDFLYRV